MKNQIAKLTQIIRDLSAVLEGEKMALAKRAFDKIPLFSQKKEALIVELESLLATLNEGEDTTALIKELDEVRLRAEENAAALKSISQGAKQARTRIQSLQAKNQSTGVYNAEGGKIANPEARTISTKL